MTSVCYAEIKSVDINDVKDHSKIANKLNEIISQVNSDMNKKASAQEVKTVNTHYQTTAQDLQVLRGNLANVRKMVGDPTGTVADVRTKFLKLMDTLDTSVVPTHTGVNP